MQNRENRFGFVGDNMTEQKRLGDIATYINGFAFKPENRGTVGLPIIRIQDLTGNAYDLGFYDGSYPKRIEINDGDVLISWSASLGVYIWNRGKALLNQHIFKVAFDKCEVNREYFVYAVRHKLKEMESKTHGATMKHIVKKDFDNTLIPFPTLSEQGKIAECNYKTLEIDFANARKVGRDVLQEHVNRYTLDKGDFIIGKIGTIGKPFFLPAKQTYTLSANTVLIKPNKQRVEPQFLFAVFQSEYMERIIDAEKKSTSQPAFGIQKIRKIEIPMPPMELQEQFAAFVEQTNKSKAAVEKALDESQLLFDSLMQKYFG